jgi:hypothetical protein
MSLNLHQYVDQPTSQRQHTINLRTYERNIPSHTLQPYLDARPVSTKYSVLPVVDPRISPSVPVIQQSTYSQEKMYNPGNSAPWSGYASNVNCESELRNQIFALQHCSQSAYVPSSKSDMYNVRWKNEQQHISQPFPKLFEPDTFSLAPPNAHAEKIGYALFNNSTRHQLKELTKETKCKSNTTI